jgi:hypothetical protein
MHQAHVSAPTPESPSTAPGEPQGGTIPFTVQATAT